MVIYGHVWPYMAIYGPYVGHIWSYIPHIWTHIQAIYGHLWPIYGTYMVIYGHIWTYMVIYGPYMGHIWPYMAIYGHIYSYGMLPFRCRVVAKVKHVSPRLHMKPCLFLMQHERCILQGGDADQETRRRCILSMDVFFIMELR